MRYRWLHADGRENMEVIPKCSGMTKRNGGSAWESNPPVGLFTRHTGFEVREGHQRPFHFPSPIPFTGCPPGKQLFLVLRTRRSVADNLKNVEKATILKTNGM